MVTMREVAAAAGVSVATVSFVVNDTKPVTPATRERVEGAMSTLGFRRNVLARALASQRTRIIAIAFPDANRHLGATALSILTSAAIEAADRGHNIVLWPVGYEDSRLGEFVRGGLVDAVMLMEVEVEDPRIELLQQLDIPFGLIGRSRGDEELLSVDIDFEQAVVDGIDHLRDLGHTEIALVLGASGDHAYGPIVRTREAFAARMQDLGLRSVVIESSRDPQGGIAAADELVQQHPQVTGVLVLNEAALFGFLTGVSRHGLSVPGDLSILGLATSSDNVAIADPMLSTLVAPGEEVGRIAATLVIDALEGRDTGRAPVLVRCELQPGGSTAAPRPR